MYKDAASNMNMINNGNATFLFHGIDLKVCLPVRDMIARQNLATSDLL